MQIEIKNISKTFKGKQILKNVSFGIKPGTVCGLLGVNGAGKSTLMKILFGLIPADSGTILFNGDKSVKEYTGALIESPAIYRNLSAFDNLKTKALLFDIPDNQIVKTLELVGLENVGKKRVGKFSLGMKQRLGVAMAILTNPKFLILDEPTNGLDPDGITELLNLVQSLKTKGVTILISSHQLHEISRVSDQIVILNQGTICYNHENIENDDLEKVFFNVVHGGL
ncbi:ABC transporter ATP-binding protein [Streptococcus sp. H49]|uniref:ABC transporter ATP-binding protein n=1 Tax=Streptococcus huangxiaojuni TaxID=3237239 RepID=UPI0034A591AF